MCGIGGFLNLENNHSYSEIKKLVTTMTNSIIHRGPDSSGFWISPDNSIAIGHRRLSIQDLSEIANQPMISDDERYYIAFNGELWKSTFKKFDKKLRSKYNFKTQKSDTEILLYILIDNIDNLEPIMNQIEGMFSFAFYDKKEDKTIFGRDFMGRLPFYYYYNNVGFTFSSEVKGLTESIEYLQYYNIAKGSRFNSSYKEKSTLEGSCIRVSILIF